MTDIAFLWPDQAVSPDFAMAAGDLVTDDGLRTAIIVSLFTDAAARDDDQVDGADRGGWWGDVAASPTTDRIGSRLWVFRRQKIVPGVLAGVRDALSEALAWLIEDQVASAVDVQVEVLRPQTLAFAVAVDRPGRGQQRFDFVWDATASSLDQLATLEQSLASTPRVLDFSRPPNSQYLPL